MSNETPPAAAVAVRNPKDLLAYLTRSRSAIEMALPRHLNPDRMMRLALTCFSTNPALRRCTPQSILASVVVASQLGLEPGIAGQGYLIPYKDTCTFVPGWQGLVSLLNNTGRATAWTGAVYEGDQWTFQLGSRPRCEHVPGPNYGDPDLLIWVYACGKVNGSEQPVIEAWPMTRVWKHRDRYNKVGNRHYSYEQPEMYARKIVLLQVLKYMPRSIELNNAITAADAAELGQTVRVEDSVVIIDGEPTDIPQGRPQFEPVKTIAEKPPQAPAPQPAPQPQPAPAPTPVPPMSSADYAKMTEEKQAAANAEIDHAGLAPEPAAEPKKPRAKQAVNEPPGPKETLQTGGVTFDDFTDWMANSGRNVAAKTWTSWETVPEAVWAGLTKDMIGVSKAVVRFGKPAEVAP